MKITYYVDNYTIYYVVIDDDLNAPVMEVRRYIYSSLQEKADCSLYLKQYV